MPGDQYDAALSILRTTNDGNDLSGSDLSLVEAVINHGESALTTIGKARWEWLKTVTANNAYRLDWLHGIENLTKDQNGYVYWRETSVEHYSFRDANAEKRAAMHLAACCSWLEKQNKPVSNENLFALYDHIRYACDMPTKDKFLVLYTISRDGPWCKCVQYPKDAPITVPEIKSFFDREIARHDPSRSGNVRYSVVTDKEKFDEFVESVQQNARWTVRALHLPHAQVMDSADEIIKAASRSISVPDLPAQSDVMLSTLGPFWTEPAINSPTPERPSL